jgi:hypothetical protein
VYRDRRLDHLAGCSYVTGRLRRKHLRQLCGLPMKKPLDPYLHVSDPLRLPFVDFDDIGDIEFKLRSLGAAGDALKRV